MENHIEGLMSEAMKNIKGMVDVNTIIGDVVTTPDGTTIIPVSKVAFGFGAGGSEFGADKVETNKNFGGGSGAGVSISPVAFLVVNKDQIRLLPVDTTMSTVDRIVDILPDVVNKFNKFVSDMSDKKHAKQNSGYAEVNNDNSDEE